MRTRRTYVRRRQLNSTQNADRGQPTFNVNLRLSDLFDNVPLRHRLLSHALNRIQRRLGYRRHLVLPHSQVSHQFAPNFSPRLIIPRRRLVNQKRRFRLERLRHRTRLTQHQTNSGTRLPALTTITGGQHIVRNKNSNHTWLPNEHSQPVRLRQGASRQAREVKCGNGAIRHARTQVRHFFTGRCHTLIRFRTRFTHRVQICRAARRLTVIQRL